MSIILTIIIFSIIVVIHEWGHMRVAKACGVHVEEFAVGMGPKLCSFKKGTTVYSIRVLPLGGFCRMADESDPEKGIMGFNDANVWKRMLICVAGPFMNFVLALAVMIAISMVTVVSTCKVAGLYEGLPAQKAGIEAGDVVTAVNGHKVHISGELNYEIAENAGKTVELTIKRGKTKMVKTITPEYNEESGRYLIGIALDTKAPMLDIGVYKNMTSDMPRANFIESVYDGYWNGIFLVRVTFESLIKLFTNDVSVSELSGPIGVTSVVGQTVEATSKEAGMIATIITLADITALLSANLGILNLLPVPALDGGRLLIYIIEVIRRKKIPPEKEGMINLAGFALLMLLAVVVAFNDVLKLMH